ncbi:FAD-dependent monooxygenase [Primorskyibacter marinus]|uniref:FAD-dependent monooxygenase n=1 Tax=Primorskyibacter marinus TaxID=1977320 RepID=UPI000E2FF792|nr:FAD-dependent monooxygenase [Primorskyibacter marinus]
MTIQGSKIAIVGGGIGGLAAALALRAKGAEVCVFEQAEALSEVGAGLQVSPNGMRVLEALGVAEALTVRSMQARAISLRDFRRSNEVLRVDLKALPEDESYWFVHRADLISVLAEAAQDAGVILRTNQRVTGVIGAAGTGLTFANGSDFACDLAVGADGINSILRPVLNGVSAPFFTGQVAWRAVIDNTICHPPHARVHMGPGRHVVTYPLRDGQALNIVAVQERREWAAEGWSHPDDPVNLKRAFAGFDAEVHQILAQVQEPILWGLFRHPVAAVWAQEGVVLLGDAAHPTLPFLAQGANMALEDAWVLADALDAPGPLADRLANYQARRLPRVRRVVDAASANARNYHLKPGPVRFAAHLGLRALGRFSPDFMLRRFDWLYRHDVTKDGRV